jgi:hypothetical protein
MLEKCARETRRPFAPRSQGFGISGSQNCNIELSHAHIRDEESYESIRPARRSKFPARLIKFPVRHELIPSLRNARPKFAVPEAQHTRKAHGGSLEQLALVPRAA